MLKEEQLEPTIENAKYLQIALDLASRIASGELRAGERLYGRSVLSSEYHVSPETIRRALRLLADMKVVEVLPQSGTRILSADAARRYVANFEDHGSSKQLREQLRSVLDEYEKLNRKTAALVKELLANREQFRSASAPLPNYEVPIPSKSALIGKSIGSVQFWQKTGGTIVAIRRAQTVLLSPGPYAEFYAGDVLILVGSASAARAAANFVAEEEGYD